MSWSSQVVSTGAAAQDKSVTVGILVPLTGELGQFGEIVANAVKLGVDQINEAGGIESLGGRPLELVIFDAGDSAEKAKNAAQRMVSQYPDLVAVTGSWLSSFTLAVSEVTERAELPMLTLSYSDQITNRGFKYIFQTSASSGSQAAQSMPTLI